MSDTTQRRRTWSAVNRITVQSIPNIFVLSAIFMPHNAKAELCPPIFGEFECPLNYTCAFGGVCKNAADQSPPQNCAEIICGKESRCVLGRCYPIEGTPCDRNVLIADKAAYAIVSDCGRGGKCVSGKCATDKCADVVCADDSKYCRDGTCQKLAGNFCFSDYDCGPLVIGGGSTQLECRANRCERRADARALDALIQQDGRTAVTRCDPGEMPLADGKCVPQDGCAQLVCDASETCLNGFCIPATIECGPPEDGSSSTSASAAAVCQPPLVCRGRQCVRDPCQDRCPPDHACIGDAGECRPWQGLACATEYGGCPPPFHCISGVCVKDECHRKVCQLGERCEGGFCVRVEGRACRSAERECGEAFACMEGKCEERIRERAASQSVGPSKRRINHQ